MPAALLGAGVVSLVAIAIVGRTQGLGSMAFCIGAGAVAIVVAGGVAMIAGRTAGRGA